MLLKSILQAADSALDTQPPSQQLTSFRQHRHQRPLPSSSTTGVDGSSTHPGRTGGLGRSSFWSGSSGKEPRSCSGAGGSVGGGYLSCTIKMYDQQPSIADTYALVGTTPPSDSGASSAKIEGNPDALNS
ncbi:unnamed protein product [Gongylonema pulchrum]|uniref:Uncharacterized protein n=1 Tax=Gongylonema pulchrum TaxID=637853 RepID=A0A183CW25_9BILA|nr:unnamed protein product [Gongylonema pulchrum]